MQARQTLSSLSSLSSKLRLLQEDVDVRAATVSWQKKMGRRKAPPPWYSKTGIPNVLTQSAQFKHVYLEVSSTGFEEILVPSKCIFDMTPELHLYE